MSLIPALNAQHISWSMHPGTTSFTSRGNIGSGFGSVLQGVHASTSRGVLDIGGKCEITQLNTITQDQNGSTKEIFGWVVRSGTDSNGPGTTSGSVLGSVVGLTTPNRTSTGAVAWSLTTTLATGRAISVPSTKHWSYGLSMPHKHSWSMDGQSVHATRGAPSSAPRHNSHNGQEDQAWQIIGVATMGARHPSVKRSWRLRARRLGAAVMKLRCGGRQGYGGSFPLASTSSTALAWTARIEGGSAASGASAVVALGVTLGSGIPFGSGANLYVGGPYIIFAGPAASSSGRSDIPLLPFIPASASGAGTFHLQGLLVNGGVIRLTNSQSVKP